MIRPGDVYGPGSVPWTLRPLEMARAGQLAVPGRGDGLMLPLYIDDLAEAVVLALAEGEAGQAYTVWDDRARVTFEEHFNRLARLAGGREARRMPRPVLELAGTAAEGWAKLRGKPPCPDRPRGDLHRSSRHRVGGEGARRARLGAAGRLRGRHATHRGVAARRAPGLTAPFGPGQSCDSI